MDGERLLRMDVDENGDGAVDWREHYGPGERLERTEYLDRGQVTRTELPKRNASPSLNSSSSSWP
jgi:hypothetical protein